MVVLGAAFQSLLFKDEQQQVYFRFIEERITKIQEVLLEGKFGNRDLIFFGDSVATNVINPKFFDNQNKWTRAFNFAIPIRELEVNTSLLSWFNETVEKKPDLAQANIVFELSFMQLGPNLIHYQFINVLSAYNTHGLHLAQKSDILSQFLPLITSTQTPYIRTQLAAIDLLRHLARLKIFESQRDLHFEWTNFIQEILIERWSNPKLFNPAWDISQRGYFDFNYKTNHELLDKILMESRSPPAQNVFYNFYKSNLCEKTTESQMLEFEKMLLQLKITRSKVHNLVVVMAPISPILYDAQKCHSYTDIFLTKIRDLGIPVFNHSNAIQQDRFFDFVHLYENGAQEWRNILVSDLNQVLKP